VLDYNSICQRRAALQPPALLLVDPSSFLRWNCWIISSFSQTCQTLNEGFGKVYSARFIDSAQATGWAWLPRRQRRVDNTCVGIRSFWLHHNSHKHVFRFKATSDFWIKLRGQNQAQRFESATDSIEHTTSFAAAASATSVAAVAKTTTSQCVDPILPTNYYTTDYGACFKLLRAKLYPLAITLAMHFLCASLLSRVWSSWQVSRVVSHQGLTGQKSFQSFQSKSNIIEDDIELWDVQHLWEWIDVFLAIQSYGIEMIGSIATNSNSAFQNATMSSNVGFQWRMIRYKS
jgi:hypothetical protein